MGLPTRQEILQSLHSDQHLIPWLWLFSDFPGEWNPQSCKALERIKVPKSWLAYCEDTPKKTSFGISTALTAGGCLLSMTESSCMAPINRHIAIFRPGCPTVARGCSMRQRWTSSPLPPRLVCDAVDTPPAVTRWKPFKLPWALVWVNLLEGLKF